MIRYSRPQIILHWMAFLVILQQFVFHDAISEAFRAAMRGQDIAFSPLVAAHVFGGILVGLFAIWRLVLRKTVGVPPELPAAPVQQMIAKGVHVALYALMLALPLSGAVAWFGSVEAAGEAHEVMKATLIAMVALHVLGALMHQFVLKDGILRRMSLRG